MQSLLQISFQQPIQQLIKRIVCFLMVGFLMLGMEAGAAIAASPGSVPFLPSPPKTQPDADDTQATSEGLVSPEELATFLNSFLPQKMQQEHVPGAVISVVKDDRLFFAKGYGYANVENNIPVEADRTLFRVASLSKLFTDTAIMQLYEKGKLDLQTDVNQYLEAFQIESSYKRPITVEHLLTQTDGTSQRLLGIVASSAKQMSPLEQFIPEVMPPFWFPPGKIYSYSNLGITLLGYLVQTISKIPFENYIEEHILKPLGMAGSTFRQPLPPNLKADLTPGYRYKNHQFGTYPFLYFNIAPAAALSTTATDIARFMIAHLQGGQYENRQILQRPTVELMHQQHFTHHPELPGTAYGFHERLENGMRMIGHAGNMPGYSSSLTLIPEQKVGIFIALNSLNPGIPRAIVTRFLDHYYSVPKPPSTNASTNVELARFTGSYRDLEYPRDTLAKLTAPFGHLHIQSEKDGTLTIQTPGLYFPTSITKKRLVPVEPLLFNQVGDDSYTAFAQDKHGRITHLFNPVNAKIGAFEKVAWYETIVFQLCFAGICAVILLSACFINPISHGLNQSNFKAPRFTRYSHLTAAIAGAFYLFPIVTSGVFLWAVGAWKLAYGIPTIVQILLRFLPVAAIASLTLLVWATLAWKQQYWSLQFRLYYTLVTIVALLFIPFLHYWNLFNFQGSLN